jgi:hypothetical protein
MQARFQTFVHVSIFYHSRRIDRMDSLDADPPSPCALEVVLCLYNPTHQQLKALARIQIYDRTLQGIT